MRPPLRGPWIDPENNETRLSQTHSGIVKFFEFPVRIPEISHRAFHLCWQRHHSPKVMNMTGFSQIKGRYKDQKRAKTGHNRCVRKQSWRRCQRGRYHHFRGRTVRLGVWRRAVQ